MMMMRHLDPIRNVIGKLPVGVVIKYLPTTVIRPRSSFLSERYAYGKSKTAHLGQGNDRQDSLGSIRILGSVRVYIVDRV